MKDFKFSDLKNEKSRVKAKCTVEDCPWCTHASLCPDRLTNKIKTYNVVHNYIRQTKNKDKEATSAWIAQQLKSILR